MFKGKEAIVFNKVLFFLTAVGVAIVSEAAPIVEYTFFDGNAGTAANTGSLGAAMDGVVRGGSIIASPFSADNNALLLGGNSGNGISMPNGFDFGSAFTVEALVRLDGLQVSQNVIFDDFGSPGVILTVDTASGALRLSTTTTDNGTVFVTDTKPIALGAWHHVAATYDGALFKLFLDGQMVASSGATGAVDNHPAVTPNVGVESDGTVFPWRGAIDDFRIHETALSVSEFNGGNPLPQVPEPSGLVVLSVMCLFFFGRTHRAEC